MGKKQKKRQMGQGAVISDGFSSSTLLHGAEYGIIKRDLARLVILNLFYLAVVLVIYFTNRNSGYLESWFGRLLNF